MTIKYVYDDGGRKDAGYKGDAGDCVARSIAIATGLSYRKVYTDLANGNASQRCSSKRGKRTKSVRNGVDVKRKWFKEYMESLGFIWVATMGIGTGCKVHVSDDELPKGKLIVSLSKHYAAVINGVLHDTFDCSHNGTRCVYGYWLLNK